MTKPAASYGTLTVHDARIGADHRLPITVLDLRDGRLHIEATGVVTLDGSVEPDDVMTIHDPAGNVVVRTWVDSHSVLRFNARERVTLVYGIALGGQRPVVMGDSTINIDL